MDIFFKNDGSYSQSTVGIPVLVDYTPVGFVREVNADMVTCSLFDKFIGKEWLAQRLTTEELDKIESMEIIHCPTCGHHINIQSNGTTGYCPICDEEVST